MVINFSITSNLLIKPIGECAPEIVDIKNFSHHEKYRISSVSDQVQQLSLKIHDFYQVGYIQYFYQVGYILPGFLLRSIGVVEINSC